MPTLYVRDVPPDLYETLRARAEREGRSINSETIALLRAELERKRAYEDILRRLRRSRERFHLYEHAALPEELIREDRDAGTRRP
jgi:plasmid stability protein